MNTDKHGRPWATVKDTKVGTTVEVDGGFACMKKGARLTVEADPTGQLYVSCNAGRHYLSGQLNYREDGSFYVGLYEVKP